MISSTCSSRLLLPLGLSFLLLFHGSLADQPSCPRHQSPRLRGRSDCRFEKITARLPNRSQESEAGFTEFWDSGGQDELECAGVEVVRHTIYPKGLVLPYYPSTPELVYVVQGRGLQGTVLPECDETYETWFWEGFSDEHQKVYRYEQGDVLALPAGALHWTYNDGDRPIVLVVLRDTSNIANQLDRNFRKFFLAGNPQTQLKQEQQWGKQAGAPGMPGTWQPGAGGQGSWQPTAGGRGSQQAPGGQGPWQSSPGGQGSWQPTPGGQGQWQPSPGGQGPRQPTPGGSGAAKPTPGGGSGGSGPWQPTPGGSGGSGSWQPTPGGSGPWQPTPGGSGQWQPTPGGSGAVEPTPGASRPWQPTPGGSGAIKPTPGGSGGSGPWQPTPGGSRPWQATPGGSGAVQPTPGGTGGSGPWQPTPGGSEPWQPTPGGSGGSRPWQPTPGGTGGVKPTPGGSGGSGPWQPTPGGPGAIKPTPGGSGGSGPWQPTPGGSGDVKPTPGGSRPWQPIPGGSGGSGPMQPSGSFDPCEICRRMKGGFGVDNPCRNCNQVGVQQEQEGYFSDPYGQRQQQTQEGFNMFAGFDDSILQETLNIDYEIMRQLKGIYDDRGVIVLAENFKVSIPEEQDQYFSPRGNGLEQTKCSTQLKANIANPVFADVYNPAGGHISSLTSQKLQVLDSLQLTAERGVLFKNALVAPHYNLNAHSIVYITNGSSHLQIVRNDGTRVFDDWVEAGQLIVVPQDFAVIVKAGEQGCEWVAFKTNEKAMTAQLAGRFSYIRALPENVIMNAYNVSLEEAKSLKYNRKEGVVLSPASGLASWSGSPMKKVKNVVLNAVFG